MRSRPYRVWAHLNEAEYNSLMRNAKRTGLCRETYIRSILAGRVPREQPPAGYYGMIRELNAIGNSLNQIAARANATGFFLAEEYEQNARALENTVLRIQAAVTLPDKQR